MATTQPAQPPSFQTMQQQGLARPPAPQMSATVMPYQQQPQMQPGNVQSPQMSAHSEQPNLQTMWGNLAQGGQQGHFEGPGASNFQPGGYQGQGPLNAAQQSNFHPAAQRSNFQIPAMQTNYRVPSMQTNYQGPQAQQQGQFNAPQGGQQVDQRTMQAIMEALGNPSRYGSQQAGQTFDLLNNRLTQQGNADKQRIDEDMAARGIFASTTAGGRMGDLATNLNQQRADFGTSIALDQAKNYQQDRASAIGQAMGFGGQQFGQGLAGFGANQAAGAQRFGQEMGQGQFGLQQTAQNYGQQMGSARFGLDQNSQNYGQRLGSAQFGLGQNQQNFGQGLALGQFGLAQNQQNFGQQAQQYGMNQQEGLNRFNAGMDRAQFGLGQQNQNWNQAYGQFGANQGAQQQAWGQQFAGTQGLQGFGQQQYNNQLSTAGFNADQDYRQNQLLMQSLGYL